MLFSEGRASHLRELSADVVSRLVKIPGIVVSASGIKAKATRISIQCRSCRTVVPNIDIKPGMCLISLQVCNLIFGFHQICHGILP